MIIVILIITNTNNKHFRILPFAHHIILNNNVIHKTQLFYSNNLEIN